MGLAATLLPPLQLERLRDAVGDRYAVEACADWDELASVCAGRPVQLAVVDFYEGGAPNFERLRVVRRRFPALALVAYVAGSVERVRDLFDAGRVGLDGLVLLDVDDAPATMPALLERAEARGVTTLLRAALTERRPDLHPLARDAVLVAVVRAHERLTPLTLARLLAVPARVLSRRLADELLPPPNKLLTWGRLLVAARLLEDGARSADGVAQALSFPSGSAFRNTSQRYLAATPGEIRTRGGARWVMDRLLGGEEPRSAPGHAVDGAPVTADGSR